MVISRLGLGTWTGFLAAGVFSVAVGCTPRTGSVRSTTSSGQKGAPADLGADSGTKVAAVSVPGTYDRRYPPSLLTRDKLLLDVVLWSANRKLAESQLRRAGFAVVRTDRGFKAEVTHKAGDDFLGTSEIIQVEFREGKLSSVKREWRPDMTSERVESVGQSFQRLAKDYEARLGRADEDSLSAVTFDGQAWSSGKARWVAEPSHPQRVNLEIFVGGTIVALSEELEVSSVASGNRSLEPVH